MYEQEDGLKIQEDEYHISHPVLQIQNRGRYDYSFMIDPEIHELKYLLYYLLL